MNPYPPNQGYQDPRQQQQYPYPPNQGYQDPRQQQPYGYAPSQGYENPQQPPGYPPYPNQPQQPYYGNYGGQPQSPYTADPHPYIQSPLPPPNFYFSEKSVRLAFVHKVYAILSIQMIFTLGIMLLFMFLEPVRKFVASRPYLYLIALGIVIVLMILLGCFTAPRRSFPLNYILLAVFTIAEGFLVGVISVRQDTMYVLYAGLITLAIVVAITIFAFQTSIDFTYLSGAMLIISLVFLGFGIIALLMRSKILYLVYCCIGVLLFSLFLLVDTQLMLGGNHSYSISPEDYVFAALNLYVDIIQIFLMLLGIFSSSD